MSRERVTVPTSLTTFPESSISSILTEYLRSREVPERTISGMAWESAVSWPFRFACWYWVISGAQYLSLTPRKSGPSSSSSMLMPVVKRLSKCRPIAPALRASAGGAFSSGARKSPAVPSRARSDTGSTATTDSVTCGASGRDTERLKRLCSEPPAGAGNLMPVSPSAPAMRMLLPPAVCSSMSLRLAERAFGHGLEQGLFRLAVRADGAGGQPVFLRLSSVRTDSAAGHLLGSVAAGLPGGGRAHESGVESQVVHGVKTRGLQVLRYPGHQADRSRHGRAGELPDAIQLVEADAALAVGDFRLHQRSAGSGLGLDQDVIEAAGILVDCSVERRLRLALDEDGQAHGDDQNGRGQQKHSASDEPLDGVHWAP